jgi:hypothetical protein
VYEERVGYCPRGWFPDTYLLFTWEMSAQQIILRYELAPNRRAADQTVLKIDEGYVQVDQLSDGYEVSTLKYLLFDDRYVPGGGQTLGRWACQLGWLDYSINQFTDCVRQSEVTTDTSSGRPSAGIDAQLQHVLDRCEAHLRQTADDTNSQLARAAGKLRRGTYTLNDYVADLGQLLARSIRDGSRSLEGQADLAAGLADLARAYGRNR